MPNGVGGWQGYQKLVLSELQRLSTAVEGLRCDVVDMRVDIGRLKVKASLWGAAAGVLAAVASLLLKG